MGNIISTDKGVYDTDTIEGAYGYLAEQLINNGVPSNVLGMLSFLYREANGVNAALGDVLADMQDKIMDKNMCFQMFRDSKPETEFITVYDVREILSKYFA